MKTLKRFGLVLIVLMVGFACSDSTTTGPGDTNNNGDQDQNGGDEETEETTVEDDKDNIQASMDETIASMEDLVNGEFSSSAENFMAGESSDEWRADISAGFESIFELESSENRFDYSSKTGIYQWDSASGSFTEPSSSNDIIVEFPSSESSSSNDATFTFSDYSDVSKTIEGEQYYIPTTIQTELAVDGEPIFGFDLNELQFSDGESLPIPSTLDLEVFTAPFTHALSFERNDDTNFSFSFDITDDGQLATGISLNLELAHSDFESLQEDDLETLGGELQLGQDLSVDFSVEDLGEFIQLEDPSENEVNNLVNAEVLYQDEKVGDLEYSAEEETLIIIYSDGSEETVDSYFEDFSAKLKTASEFKTSIEDWINFEN